MAGNENVFSTFRAAMSMFDWGSNLKVLKLGIYNSDEPKYVTLAGQSKVANAWSKRKEEAFRAMLYLWPLIKLESKVGISFENEDDGDHEMKQSFFEAEEARWMAIQRHPWTKPMRSIAVNARGQDCKDLMMTKFRQTYRESWLD
ncbi:hypothetical protein C1H76_4672 [Elsinoe australis]|uniref:Uncharacterized protein n=1 Tax=Elsinoe australis TaxID=40998 RepID=A0A4U7B4S2_9PEZI|nr:hypothetical protein C1H76_4672 [Elsinoe australis]